jgi:hypothetical protein
MVTVVHHEGGTVARRALLIGSETFGLAGVGNDVDAIDEQLLRRGFGTVRCEDADATRAGILDAYERLIADTEPGDAVVVYYSGHGGLSHPPAANVTDLPARRWQFIVPFDFHESTESDFRGITAFELSSRLAGLTAKTRNVVVVLDCCHSAWMSKDPDLRVKALYRPVYADITEHVARVRRDEQHRPAVLGNPDAVRVVACAPDESAFEYTNSHGRRTGILTESLVTALSEAGDLPVTWSTLLTRIRHRVQLLSPNQRPEAEGPFRRRLFDLTEVDPDATLPVLVPRSFTGRATLPGARLLGVQAGDEFVVLPADALPGEIEPIATIAIDRVGATAADGVLALRAGVTAVPTGARAHPVRLTAPAMPVRVAGGVEHTAGIRRLLEASPLVRLARPDDDPVVVTVRADDEGRLTIHDRVGPLYEPRPPASTGDHAVLGDLVRIARAQALRELADDPRFALAGKVTVEWGTVADGKPVGQSRSGGRVHVGDHVYVRVRNEGPSTVYVSLLDVGVASKITLITAMSPSGVELAPGQEYVMGRDDLDYLLEGVPLTWPLEIAGTDPRPETIIVLATSAPQDVSVLEQEGVRRRAVAEGSPLEQALTQLATGCTRDLSRDLSRGRRKPKGPAVRYAVQSVTFDLSPALPPAPDVAKFLIDERPSLSVRTAPRPRTATTPAAVAVRLDELIVHRNRALRSADLRIDAMVLTGSGGAEPVFRTATTRFSDVNDGDRLPMDDLLVYHGPAVDFLDIAVWVSRDRSGALELGDLLKTELTGVELQDAMTTLLGLTVAAPQSAVAAASIGAASVIVNVAYRVLSRVVGDQVGLYRTSLLHHERFGVGRHPANGHLRAQDFSFAYTVTDVTRRSDGFGQPDDASGLSGARR